MELLWIFWHFAFAEKRCYKIYSCEIQGCIYLVNNGKLYTTSQCIFFFFYKDLWEILQCSIRNVRVPIEHLVWLLLLYSGNFTIIWLIPLIPPPPQNSKLNQYPLFTKVLYFMVLFVYLLHLWSIIWLHGYDQKPK